MGLTAGADPAAIAARIGVPASTIAAYAAVFMDVAGKLKAEGHIIVRFLRVGSDPIRDPVVVRRTVGYREGWDALCRYLDTGALSPAMREYVAADSTRHRLRRAWLAVEAMEVRPGNAARAARLCAWEMAEAEVLGDPAGGWTDERLVHGWDAAAFLDTPQAVPACCEPFADVASADEQAA